MNMENIKKELNYQEHVLRLLEKTADPAVKGSLCRQQNKDGSLRYYHVFINKEIGKKCYKRITARDAGLVRTLAANKLYSDWKRPLEHNIGMLRQLAEEFRPIDLNTFSGVMPLHSDGGQSSGLSGFDWEKLKASAGNYRPEGLLYEADGNKFRSKGEALHAMCFANEEIEYIYEPEIRLGPITLHPDFAVRNKRTGKIYFWEYFGMLDVKEYRDSFCRKLPALMELGIIPGHNLICTCEFKGVCELSVEEIQAKIRAYLL